MVPAVQPWAKQLVEGRTDVSTSYTSFLEATTWDWYQSCLKHIKNFKEFLMKH